MTEHSSEDHCPRTARGSRRPGRRWSRCECRSGWTRWVGVPWPILGVVLLAGVTLQLWAWSAACWVPLAAAVVIAAIVVPLVDLLERWHVRRWLAAALVPPCSGWPWSSPVNALNVIGVIEQSDEIAAQATSAYRKAADAEPPIDSGGHSRGGGFDDPGLGAGLLIGSLGSAVGLVVGTVRGVFILLFLLTDWDRIIGVGNAMVVGVGALVLGVPLAGTIAIVTCLGSTCPTSAPSSPGRSRS